MSSARDVCSPRVDVPHKTEFELYCKNCNVGFYFYAPNRLCKRLYLGSASTKRNRWRWMRQKSRQSSTTNRPIRLSASPLKPPNCQQWSLETILKQMKNWYLMSCAWFCSPLFHNVDILIVKIIKTARKKINDLATQWISICSIILVEVIRFDSEEKWSTGVFNTISKCFDIKALWRGR